MPPEVKICGLKTAAAVDAAVQAGAKYLGFVLSPSSPKSISLDEARALAARIPPGQKAVGVFADDDDEFMERALSLIPIDMIQLQGDETPGRVTAIKSLFGLPVIKAFQVGSEKDLAALDPYRGIVDIALLDARPPKNVTLAFPGSADGMAFDWSLLSDTKVKLPWMLSGGLTPANLREALDTTRARRVDVSSGVESPPGQKSPDLIRAFIAEAIKTA